MDQETLVKGLEFSHGRLLGVLETIEKSGQSLPAVLAWRPAPGRAHIAWQAMHCAATLDRYINVRLKNAPLRDDWLVTHFASGSTPSDTDVPALADIRRQLSLSWADTADFVRSLAPADLERKTDLPNNVQRTIGESIMLLTWHEAHHQGQIHLTWNLYKQAHGL